jgi:uncharacterized protein (TIGR02145 family)
LKRNLFLGNLVLAVTLFLITFSCGVKDKDGNTYKVVKISNQEWMVENLNVSTFRNGDSIPEAKTDEEWEKAGKEGQPAWCYNANNPANVNTYGKLYNWYAVRDSRGLAPAGWHVPTDTEWTQLTDFLGGGDVAGAKMKSTAGWVSNGNGTNESGFLGLPGDSRGRNGAFGSASDGGTIGCWWSSTEAYTNYAWTRYLSYTVGYVYKDYYYKELGFSVRCLRD